MCRVVRALAAICCRLARPSGPIILYQEESTRCVAMFWPPPSRAIVLGRCIRGLKCPSDVEKSEKAFRFGLIRVWASFESSRAMAIPRIVTRMAVSLMDSGMVIGGVFVGTM